MKAIIQIRAQPSYRREAFERGLRAVGYTEFHEYKCARHWPNGPDDLLVLWNLMKGPDEAYAAAWEKRGGTVLVCENGYLQREDKTYYAISTHGHNGSGWYPLGEQDGARRFARLGFDLKPMDGLRELVVVRGQRGIGSKLMASPPRWAEKHAARLRAKGVRVVVMPHPGDKGKLAADLKMIEQAGVVHIWSSAMGVRALVEGVPVVHHAPKWICAGWIVGGREWALQNMACAQWHHEEIATGEPFARMRAESWGVYGAGKVSAPTKEIAR